MALTQSRMIKSMIEAGGKYSCEIIKLETKGDKILNRSLPEIGDKGLFTKELEDNLLGGSIDLAVHSLKDLPTELPAGLTLGAVPRREDERDVFISSKHSSFAEVPSGGIIASGSLRRRVQLKRKRPDIVLEDLRGNVPTRIEKMKSRGFDGIILASAGLKRLGLEKIITQVFDPSFMVPAAGQGALGIEIREDDERMNQIMERLNDETSSIETGAERIILSALGGSCQIPIGITARAYNGKLSILAFVSDLNAQTFIESRAEGPVKDADITSSKIIDELMKQGAMEIVEKGKAG